VNVKSDVLRNNLRDHHSHIRHSATSGRIQERVFVERQIMNNVAKFQILIHRPVCETLLRAPDKLVRTNRLRAETLCHDLLVQRSIAHLWVSAALLPVQLQQLIACLPGEASLRTGAE